MEELWHSILEFLSPYVIPDWGELIGLLPVLLGLLVLLWFAWTLRRFATAGPTRRAPARVAPVAPPDLHMPGPSFSPVLAALGAAALFWGLVVGGMALVIGTTILCLTLLYWGREALREYDHMTHADSALPAVVHPGPPPGVHMPGPSFRPVLGAIGTAALFAGLVFGGWVLAAGVIILILTLVGWLVDANAEYRERVKADVTGHLENPPAPGWPRGLFQVIGVLFVAAVLIQAGIFPPRIEAPGSGGEPGGSPAPSGPAGPPPAEHEVVAVNIEFDVKTLEAPADSPWTITFDNQDAPGVLHDIDIRTSDGTVVQDVPQVNGGESETYNYEPLEAGEYVFICSVHPIPLMTGTLTVR